MMTPKGRAVLDELRIKQGLDPKLPWGGRSPRELTAAHARFSLEPGGDADEPDDFFVEDIIDEQARRFHYGT